jgi:hypothetical protein
MENRRDRHGGVTRMSRRFERARIEAQLFAEVCEILLRRRGEASMTRDHQPRPRSNGITCRLGAGSWIEALSCEHER